MATIQHRQAVAVGALALILLACLLAVIASLHARSAALQELGEKSELLSRLEARSRAGARAQAPARIGEAPASAFLAAPTAGLAAAQLQSYLAKLLNDQNGVLVSSGVQPTTRDDTSDAIRVQATVNTTLRALQSLLYRLESGTPYVFVDQLSVQQPAGPLASAEPQLRVTLGLRAVWRRSDA